MKHLLVGVLCVAVLWTPWAFAQEKTDAQDELLEVVRELQKRLEKLEAQHAQEREAYEESIAALKQRVAELEERLTASQEAPAPADALADLLEEGDTEGEEELASLLQGMETGTQPAEGGGLGASLSRAFQSFNPDISIIGDFVGHYSSNEGGQLDDEFLFREIELGFSGNIDTFARADIFMAVGREDGEWGIDLEEGYMTLLTLPHDIQPRIGRFKSTFGKANGTHLHALPWVEYPYVIQNYFGDEGLSGEGVGVSWLIPNPWDRYMEVTYEVINNDNSLFAGQESDDFAHVVHFRDFAELTPASTLETGLSFATAPNDRGHGGNRSMIEALDLTYKWKPPREGLYKSFIWQNEFMFAQADLHGGQETSWGMYSAADYQFARQWSVGARYDYSQMPYSSSLHEHGYSAYLTFLQSEYVFWRLAYQYTDRNFRVDGNRNEHEVFLQCNFGLGPHRAHKY